MSSLVRAGALCALVCTALAAAAPPELIALRRACVDPETAKAQDGYAPPTIPDPEGSPLSLYIPPEATVVRGILFVHGQQEKREAEIVEAWGFAQVFGNIWDPQGQRQSHDEQIAMFNRAITAWSKVLRRPELVNVPIIYHGGSRTSALGPHWSRTHPGKILSWSCAIGNPYRKGQLTVDAPGLIIGAEKDGYNQIGNDALAGRVPVAEAIMWGYGHEGGTSRDLAWPFHDQMIRLRLPADADGRTGPVQLKPIAFDQGWAGSTDYRAFGTWIEARPLGDWKGPGTWLANEAVATVWRGYCTRNPATKIIAPTNERHNKEKWTTILYRYGGYTVKQPIVFEAEVTGTATSVEFLASGRPLGTATAAPWRVTAAIDVPGVHGILALTTFSDGRKEYSHPAILAIHAQPMLGD